MMFGCEGLMILAVTRMSSVHWQLTKEEISHVLPYPFLPSPQEKHFSFGGEGTATRKLTLLIRPKTCNVSQTWFFDYEVRQLWGQYNYHPLVFPTHPRIRHARKNQMIL